MTAIIFEFVKKGMIILAILLVGLFILQKVIDRIIFKAKDVPADTLPCPFCGGKNLKTVHSIHHYVSCHDCGAMGHYGKTREEAILLWNRRQG